jgi:hypothetical protein
MSEFRLIQFSDPHLTRRHASLTDNFHRLSDHIAAKRPDLVIDSGDMAFDAPTNPGDLEFAKSLHAALPVECRYLPGNHDVGDNPTAIGPKPSHPASDQRLQAYHAIFGEDRWRFEAAGWCFVGLNSLVMNSGLAREAEQFDWLASQLSTLNGKPLALFLHKPLFLNAPDDPELESSAIRYVPMPAGIDRDQGDRPGGISLPARCLRGPACPGAGTGQCRPRLPARQITSWAEPARRRGLQSQNSPTTQQLFLCYDLWADALSGADQPKNRGNADEGTRG